MLFHNLCFIVIHIDCFLVGIVTRLAGGGSASGVSSGFLDGTGSVALFYSPRDVVVDNIGNVIVTDTSNMLIRMISPLGMYVEVVSAVSVSVSVLELALLVSQYICFFRRSSHTSGGGWRKCNWNYIRVY